MLLVPPGFDSLPNDFVGHLDRVKLHLADLGTQFIGRLSIYDITGSLLVAGLRCVLSDGLQ
jgi:hypothetical protein